MPSPPFPSANHAGHSAEVEMLLCLNGQTLSIGQLGPDFLILDTPIDHPPTNAVLFLSVDGDEEEWEAHLRCSVKRKSHEL